MQELKDRMAQLQTEYFAAAKTEFATASRGLFDANPKLESFSWTQYSPYFNDGDECTFSAHIDYPEVNGIEEYGDGYDEDAAEKVKEFLGAFEESVLEEMFGNHKKVTVTRGEDGPVVETEEYDHD